MYEVPGFDGIKTPWDQIPHVPEVYEVPGFDGIKTLPSSVQQYWTVYEVPGFDGIKTCCIHRSVDWTGCTRCPDLTGLKRQSVRLSMSL